MKKNSRTKEKSSKRKRNYAIILSSIIAFLIGYYILNYLSTMERPPINNTVLIILGCIMMAGSTLIAVITFKKQFFPTKKTRSRHVFLKDQLKNQNVNQDGQHNL